MPTRKSLGTCLSVDLFNNTAIPRYTLAGIPTREGCVA